jgi:anion-transporting  ArsA/GET3 family ATPase
MSRIITFLGQVGAEHTTMAIATAKWFAQQNKRVLLVTHQPSPSAELLLDMPLTAQPQVIAPQMDAVQLQTTVLLEQAWDGLKQLLLLYLPIPALSDAVYPGELMILPGLDSFLAFHALSQYYTSGDYDVIVYDGRGDLETLRLLGIPNVLEWYFRRFRQVFEAMDVAKVAETLAGPIASAFVTANLNTKKIDQEMNQIHNWITQGVAVVNDPQRLTAYMVTTDEPGAIAAATWLWGSAQQVNLRVSGVLISQSQGRNPSALQQAFAPLAVHAVPTLCQGDWEPLIQALPNFTVMPSVLAPLTVNLAQRQVQFFLPGFTKKQVKLTQFGSELTVEAGDQRRNFFLPPELRGQHIQAGKFEAPYLIVSF